MGVDAGVQCGERKRIGDVYLCCVGVGRRERELPAISREKQTEVHVEQKEEKRRKRKGGSTTS